MLGCNFAFLNRWIEGYGSPPGRANGLIDCHGCLTFASADPKETAAELLPDILRLSIDCPYEDVRERCAFMLADLKVTGHYLMAFD
jgi:hypothetical protein